MSVSEDDRKLALALHFAVRADQVEHADDYGMGDQPAYRVEGQPGTYSVLTDEEANDLWDASLDSYLDECVLSDLPEVARNYFDEEAWKRDARYDGRGHAINSYDGNEHEVQMPPEYAERWLYIYRVS